MSVSTLTSKGQVTIPKDVRHQLQLQPGDKLDFRVGPDQTVTVTPLSKRAAEVFGLLAKETSKSYSVKEINRQLGKRLGRRQG
jgi:antitoxin PrlF